jgi:hypothetical protein
LWTTWRHYVLLRAVWFTCGSLLMICQQQAAVISSISHFFSVTVSEQSGMSWCSILWSKICICVTPMWRTDLLESVRENVPRRKTIHSLVNKLRTMGILIDKKQKHKCPVLIEEKLDDTGVRFEYIHRKPLKSLT